MILEKKIYKKIESHMYTFFDDTEQLEIEQADIIYGCKTKHLGEETGGSVSTTNESKVENAAIQLIELKEDKNVKWINVIKDAIKEFSGTEYEKLIDLTYNKQYQLPKILRLMHIEKTCYYEKKNDVILQIALKAAYNGLFENRIKKVVGEKK